MHRGQLIAKFAVQRDWRQGAELGVWRGKTLAMVLSECPELEMIGVDIWAHHDNEMEGYQEWDHETNEQTARKVVEEFGDRVELLKMTTKEASLLVPDRSLDFVFIDADHRTTAVVEDISLWRDKVNSRGVIMGHDINLDSVKEAVMQFDRNYHTELDDVWWFNA